MKKLFVFFSIILLCASVYAQQEPAAKASLEKAVAMIRTSAVKISFATTVEQASGKKISVAGTIIMTGNKYKLQMSGSEVYFDGQTQWVYASDNNEVTVSSISPKEQKKMNPLSVLSQYNGKDTKILFSREAPKSANTVVIDLYPTSKSANEFHIIVQLNKQTYAPQSLQLFSRDGTKTTVTVKSFQKISIDNKQFIFDTKAHPKVNINDLR